MIRTLKGALNPNELGVEIKEMKKTRKGGLLLTVKNGTDKAEVLLKEINERIPEAKTSFIKTKKTVFLKGLDEATTEDEVRKSVAETLAVKPDSFEVKSLRPAYGNQQNVTLVMYEEQANTLITLGEIKVGWTKSKIKEREPNLKCFRCWETGHTRDKCVNPSREALCLKCGKTGHKAATCKENPFCIFCKKEGHQSGGTKCVFARENKMRKDSYREQDMEEAAVQH